MPSRQLTQMNQQDFFNQPDAQGFVEWLCLNLDSLTFKLDIKRSPKVSKAIKTDVRGVEALLQHYAWKASWDDQGVAVNSEDWASTRHSLGLLRARLGNAVADGDEQRTLEVCLAVLRWGGVDGAMTFLKQLRAQNGLVAYLQDCRRLFDPFGTQRLDDLNPGSILLFDAGLTKIHALLDGGGSPIYDSRVGAASAMLYALYRQTASHPALLRFPSGGARGEQVRNPNQLGFSRAPQFYTEVKNEKWARYQVILGWIIRRVLSRTQLFIGMGSDPSARAHALEAALFIAGYDLRCLDPTP